MAQQFQPPTGTADTAPPESARWEALIALFAQRAKRAGFGLVISPMFDDPALWRHGAGESSDVVRKEMYEFEDKGGRPLALRPEGTAGVMRAYLDQRPVPPWKVWYAGAHFRYERPQAGRLRQHHQVGVEAIGSDDPDLDVEVIALHSGFLRDDLGLRQLRLQVNSLGDAECRPVYRQALLEHLAARRAELCEEHRVEGRIEANPLRILDCKKRECVQATTDAPLQVDYLCDDCAAHFQRVRAGLDRLGIDYELAPRLVRGLDYYNRTTYEFAAEALQTAQNGIGGGGRYDGLAEILGGAAAPGIGFGSGIERILLACDAEGVFPAPESVLDAFVVDITGGELATDIVHELRDAGISADRAYGGRSMKAQMKASDRSGARFAVLIGPDEAAAGTTGVRDLRQPGTEQDTVERSDLIDYLRKRLDS